VFYCYQHSFGAQCWCGPRSRYGGISFAFTGEHNLRVVTVRRISRAAGNESVSVYVSVKEALK
jgi:hypothetical protein